MAEEYIYISGGETNLQIVDNIISENSTSGGGGGIGLNGGGTPFNKGNVIRNNVASFGGGIEHLNFSDSLIVQNLITGNSGLAKGGGVMWTTPSSSRGPWLVNNTIALNTAPVGTQIHANRIGNGVELFNHNVVAAPGETVIFTDILLVTGNMGFNNNVFSDRGDAYAGAGSDPSGTNGNVSFDPIFVDAAANDFRLLPNSRLIDLGINSAPSLPHVDLDGRLRILDGNSDSLPIVDIGAFEFVPEPSTLALVVLFAWDAHL